MGFGLSAHCFHNFYALCRAGVNLSASGQSGGKRFVYFFGAEVYAGDDAIRVDQKSGGDGSDMVLFGLPAAKILVFHGMVFPIHSVRRNGALPGFRALFDANAEHLESPVVVLGIEAGQCGVFSSAGAAPAAPELEQDIFPFQIAQAGFFALEQRNFKIGRCIAHDKIGLAIAIPRECQ